LKIVLSQMACQHRNKTTAFPPVLTTAATASKWRSRKGVREELHFSVDRLSRMVHDQRRLAKRRWLLESGTKE
jgi:hypothetical protein